MLLAAADVLAAAAQPGWAGQAALSAEPRARSIGRGALMLRLDYLSGDMRWVAAAARALEPAADQADEAEVLRLILSVELQAPEKRIIPAFLIPRILAA